MTNLRRSTLLADTALESCLCVRECVGCSHDGTWHNHADEVCPLHPDTVVDTPTDHS